jgi:hypothetical protein
MDWRAKGTTHTCSLDCFLTVLILLVQKKQKFPGFPEVFQNKLEDVFKREPPNPTGLSKSEHRIQHEAYFVEENLRHLIFLARKYALGLPEKGLESMARWIALSMTFPSNYLRNLEQFDPQVYERYDFIDVNARLKRTFAPMSKIILKVSCSSSCSHFVPDVPDKPGVWQRYDDNHYFLFVEELRSIA